MTDKVRVLDKQGRILLVSPALAQNGQASGEYKVLGDVTVVKEGKSKRVSPDKLYEASRQGYTAVTEHEAKDAEYKESARGTMSQVLGVAESLARGVLPGVYDQTIRAAGADMRAAKARRDQSGGGGEAIEGVGALASGLLTGGVTSALARGVAAKAGGSVAARAAAEVAVGAAEGGLWTMGANASEAALGDENLNAERLFNGIGAGMLMGGAIGGGVAGVAGMMKRAEKLAPHGADEMLKRTMDIGAGDNFKKSVGSLREWIANVPDDKVRAMAITAGKDPELWVRHKGYLADKDLSRRWLADEQMQTKELMDSMAPLYREVMEGYDDAFQHARGSLRFKHIVDQSGNGDAAAFDAAAMLNDIEESLVHKLDANKKSNGVKTPLSASEKTELQLLLDAKREELKKAEKAKKANKAKSEEEDELTRQMKATIVAKGGTVAESPDVKLDLRTELRKVRDTFEAKRIATAQAAADPNVGSATDMLHPSEVNVYKSQLRDVRRTKAQIEVAKGAGDVNLAMDNLQREWATRHARMSSGGKGHIRLLTHESQSADRLRMDAGMVAKHLSSKSLYGKGAESYVRVSNALDAEKAAFDELRNYDQKMYDTLTSKVADEDTVLKMLRQGNKVSGTRATAAHLEALEARVAAMDAIAESYSLPPELSSLIARQKGAVDKIKKATLDHRKTVEIIDDRRAMQRMSGEGFGTQGSAVARAAARQLMQIIGFGAGGLPGAAAATLASGLFNQYSGTRMLMGAMAFLENSKAINLSGVYSAAKVIGKTAYAAALEASNMTARAAEKAMRASIKPTVFMTSRNDAEKRSKMASEVEANVNAFMTSPAGFADSHAEVFSDAMSAMPNTAAAMVGVSMLAYKHLAENMPPVFRDAVTGDVLMSEPHEAELLNRCEAIADPGSISRRFADGSLTKEHVHAADAVYPGMMQEIRYTLAYTLATAGTTGEAIPFNYRLSAETLLNTKSLDVLQPSRLYQIQATHGESSASQPRSGRGRKISAKAAENRTKSYASSVSKLSDALNG